MSKAKLCFIGAGFHASTNIYPAVIGAGAEIQAIATRDLSRSKTALQRFGSSGTPYDNYKAMLEQEDCDGVVVIAQAADHPSLVLDCIKAGKHVFVDKPLGWNAEEVPNCRCGRSSRRCADGWFHEALRTCIHKVKRMD